jgi:hypothetical protein
VFKERECFETAEKLVVAAAVAAMDGAGEKEWWVFVYACERERGGGAVREKA